jgi:Cu/Ag efflux pump CusA
MGAEVQRLLATVVSGGVFNLATAFALLALSYTRALAK